MIMQHEKKSCHGIVNHLTIFAFSFFPSDFQETDDKEQQ
jgi:hypothetical protein